MKNASVIQVADDLRGTPEKFTVSQNYPNPFNPETHISFTLPLEARVKLEIFNVLGERVYQESRSYPEGYHIFLWRAETNEGLRVPSGIYFLRLSTPTDTATRRMILLR